MIPLKATLKVMPNDRPAPAHVRIVNFTAASGRTHSGCGFWTSPSWARRPGLAVLGSLASTTPKRDAEVADFAQYRP
jgi:hypothetical protein